MTDNPIPVGLVPWSHLWRNRPVVRDTDDHLPERARTAHNAAPDDTGPIRPSLPRPKAPREFSPEDLARISRELRAESSAPGESEATAASAQESLAPEPPRQVDEPVSPVPEELAAAAPLEQIPIGPHALSVRSRASGNPEPPAHAPLTPGSPLTGHPIARSRDGDPSRGRTVGGGDSSKSEHALMQPIAPRAGAWARDPRRLAFAREAGSEQPIPRLGCDWLELFRICRHARCRRAQHCCGEAEACLRAGFKMAPESARDLVSGLMEAEELGIDFEEAFDDAEEHHEGYYAWLAGLRAACAMRR